MGHGPTLIRPSESETNEVRSSLFVRHAAVQYLTAIAGNYGFARNRVGFQNDDFFRAVARKMMINYKTTVTVIYDLLDIILGPGQGQIPNWQANGSLDDDQRVATITEDTEVGGLRLTVDDASVFPRWGLIRVGASALDPDVPGPAQESRRLLQTDLRTNELIIQELATPPPDGNLGLQNLHEAAGPWNSVVMDPVCWYLIEVNHRQIIIKLCDPTALSMNPAGAPYLHPVPEIDFHLAVKLPAGNPTLPLVLATAPIPPTPFWVTIGAGTPREERRVVTNIIMGAWVLNANLTYWHREGEVVRVLGVEAVATAGAALVGDTVLDARLEHLTVGPIIIERGSAAARETAFVTRNDFVQFTLTGDVQAADTTLSARTTQIPPATPFWLRLNPGGAPTAVVEVTAVGEDTALAFAAVAGDTELIVTPGPVLPSGEFWVVINPGLGVEERALVRRWDVLGANVRLYLDEQVGAAAAAAAVVRVENSLLTLGAAAAGIALPVDTLSGTAVPVVAEVAWDGAPGLVLGQLHLRGGLTNPHLAGVDVRPVFGVADTHAETPPFEPDPDDDLSEAARTWNGPYLASSGERGAINDEGDGFKAFRIDLTDIDGTLAVNQDRRCYATSTILAEDFTIATPIAGAIDYPVGFPRQYHEIIVPDASVFPPHATLGHAAYAATFPLPYQIAIDNEGIPGTPPLYLVGADPARNVLFVSGLTRDHDAGSPLRTVVEELPVQTVDGSALIEVPPAGVPGLVQTPATRRFVVIDFGYEQWEPAAYTSLSAKTASRGVLNFSSPWMPTQSHDLTKIHPLETAPANLIGVPVVRADSLAEERNASGHQFYLGGSTLVIHQIQYLIDLSRAAGVELVFVDENDSEIVF